MKKYLNAGVVLVLSLALVACGKQEKPKEVSSTNTSTSSMTTTQSSTTSSVAIKYKSTQSKELSPTTYLFNEADVADAKTIQRYVELTGNYEYDKLTQEEADKRLAELKSLKVNSELAPDESVIYSNLLALAESGASLKSEVLELGIFKDTTAEADPDGKYDTTYQVFQTIRISRDDKEVSQTSLVAMVWTKDHKIQSSYSIADLNKVDTSESFFNGIN